MYNQNILAFLKAKINNEENVEFSFEAKASKSLEAYLEENSIFYLKNVKIKNNIIPYYSEEQNRIFLAAKRGDYTKIDGKEYLTGNVKFMSKIIRHCTGKNVSILDIIENKLINYE